MKKLAAHITFFANIGRLHYLNQVISGICSIYGADVFVHTNRQITGIDHRAIIIVHDIEHMHPYNMAYQSRSLMAEHFQSYDFIMYIEDDIYFDVRNFEYYEKYHNFFKGHSSYIQFLRYEINEIDGGKYFTDICDREFLQSLDFDNNEFFQNIGSRYSGMWILDKDEMKQFITCFSDLFWLKQQHYQGGINMLRENCAIGPYYEMFKISVVKCDPACLIQHIPGNYANNLHTQFGKIPVWF